MVTQRRLSLIRSDPVSVHRTLSLCAVNLTVLTYLLSPFRGKTRLGCEEKQGIPSMAVGHFLPIVTLWAILLRSEVVVSEVKISITPPDLPLTPDRADNGEGHVNVTCQSTQLNDNRDYLWQLSIVRKLHGIRKEAIIVAATMRERNGAAVLRSEFPAGAAKASGDLGSGAIGLHLHQASCLDSGSYICRATYHAEGNSSSKPKAQRSKTLTVRVTPGPLSLTVSPNGKSRWEEGDVLTMTCQGPIGTVGNESKLEWVWEYRYALSRNTRWLPYDGDLEDVKPGPRVTGTCYTTARSTLTRRLLRADKARQYRCYVKIDGVAFLDYAAQNELGAVHAAGDPVPPLHTSLFLGMGVGGCVGMVVGLVVVVAGVIALVWRRRCLSAKTKDGVSCPLLPEHRDPAQYGEYLEPIGRRPVSDDRAGSVYSEIPYYEDMEASQRGTPTSS